MKTFSHTHIEEATLANETSLENDLKIAEQTIYTK